MGLAVLYIEDDVMIAHQNLMLAKQHKPNLHIFVAQDFSEAAGILRDEGPIDIIVSDFQFPGIGGAPYRGGIDFYQHSARVAPEIPFIFLTNSVEAGAALAKLPEFAEHPPLSIYTKGTFFYSVVQDWIDNKCPALKIIAQRSDILLGESEPIIQATCDNPRANILARGFARLRRVLSA